MRRRILRALAVLSVMGLAVAPAQTSLEGWQSLADGIAYRTFIFPGPVRAYVARLDRAVASATIDTMFPLAGPPPRFTETVSQMASRYHDAVNTWDGTWGGRNRVVVAINGGFFNAETGVPDGGQVQAGSTRGWVGNPVGLVSFGWTMDRQAHLGQCVYLPADKQRLTHLSTGVVQPIDGLNFRPEGAQVVLYTPEYGAESPGDGRHLEVLIEMTRPALMIPPPRTVIGTVRAVHQGGGPYPIPFDHVVLSVSGPAREVMLENVGIDRRIGLSQEMVDLGPDCNGGGTRDWGKTYAGLGGGFPFLRDGEVYTTDQAGANIQDPRTALCFNDEAVYFVIVDGRQRSWSLGMTIEELGHFCRDTLGATWGINQDGGGSSTMWVNGAVTNHPSDGSERPVANGMMLVSQEPAALSSAYRPSDLVAVTQPAALRLGPGTNFGERATLPVGIYGQIDQPLSGLNGVFAKGSYWWHVAFGRTIGWVSEEALAPLSGVPSPPPSDVWSSANP